MWMIRPDVIMMLFKTCVMPTFEYGVIDYGEQLVYAPLCGSFLGYDSTAKHATSFVSLARRPMRMATVQH